MNRFRLLLMMGLVALVATVQAQNQQSLIQLVLGINLRDHQTFDGIICTGGGCPEFSDLIYPLLIETMPDGTLRPADLTHQGLVQSVSTDDAQTYRLQLHPDAQWSDGTAITTDDVLYSYSRATRYDGYIALDRRIVDMQALSLTELEITFDEPNCATLTNLPDVSIMPAHVYAPDFVSLLADGYDWQAWISDEPPLALLSPFRDDLEMIESLVTADHLYHFVEWQYSRAIRLEHGRTGQYLELIQPSDPIDLFYAGEIALWERPPIGVIDDALNRQNIDLLTRETDTTHLIWFNLEDPRDRLDYRDEDGEIQEQVPHPVLSDPAIREALALAINHEELIELGMSGYARPLTGIFAPPYWVASSGDMSTYDPERAERILHDAGWVRSDNRSTRYCATCANPDSFGRAARIELTFQDGVSRELINRLAEQWERVGFDVLTEYTAVTSVNYRNYEVLYQVVTNPDAQLRYLSTHFDPEQDSDDGFNTTNIYDEQLTDWLTEAQTIADCDVETRRDLIAQAQDRMIEMNYVIPILQPQEMLLIQDDVMHIDPNQPDWNLAEWTRWTMEVRR